MSTIKAAIRSMRLRTLPLSLAGVLLGILLAAPVTALKLTTTLFLLLTTVSLQILSNLSNELGDTLLGTDTLQRQGPMYSLASGELSIKLMRRLILSAALACVLFGTLMTYFSFHTLLCKESLVLLALGGAAITCAIRYTLGKNPYGYRGLGDLSVFVFFGIVSTAGAYYTVSHTVSAEILLPASTMGFFSVGVLNVNNIRDMETDAANRLTVAIRLGLGRARKYQVILIVSGWLCMVAYTLLQPARAVSWLYTLTLPLYLVHLKGALTRQERDLDPMLPLLVISTFLFSLLAGIAHLL